MPCVAFTPNTVSLTLVTLLQGPRADCEGGPGRGPARQQGQAHVRGNRQGPYSPGSPHGRRLGRSSASPQDISGIFALWLLCTMQCSIVHYLEPVVRWMRSGPTPDARHGSVHDHVHVIQTKGKTTNPTVKEETSMIQFAERQKEILQGTKTETFFGE